MRIAYLTNRYPAISHTFILREVRALRASGVDVDTFTIRRPYPDDLCTAEDREESRRTFSILPAGPIRLIGSHLVMLMIHRFRYLAALWTAFCRRPPGLRAAIWHLFYFGEAGILAFNLRKYGIRHIHVHFAGAPAAIAMLVSEMSGVTWSLTLHGLADFGNPASLCLDEKIRSAAFVVCVSDFGRAQAMLNSEPKMWDKIHRVHCGINPKTYVLRHKPADNANSRPIRVLTVGRLEPEKGHVVLLRALERVVHQGTAVHCTIVGDGTERRRLEELAQTLHISDHVVFVGAIGQDRLQEHYDNADTFVLSSFAEGLPVVLMEAMAKELPVIASHIMGVPELVEDGITGMLVPPGRIVPLAAAIVKLAASPNLRRTMGVKGRKKVCRMFDVRLAARTLSKLFSEIGTETASAKAPLSLLRWPARNAVGGLGGLMVPTSAGLEMVDEILCSLALSDPGLALLTCSVECWTSGTALRCCKTVFSYSSI